MQTTRSRPKLTVSTDGARVVAHAGTRLLADVADTTGLTGAFSDALAGEASSPEAEATARRAAARRRRPGRDDGGPGKGRLIRGRRTWSVFELVLTVG